jgi:flagellar biogenesis protein FliO
MRGLGYLLIAICWLSPAGIALAEIGDGATQRITPRATDHAVRRKPGPEKRGAATASWTTVAGSLTVVLVLVIGLAKLFRQRGMLAPVSLPREAVHVLGRKPIDYRNTIHLVRCGSRLLVLGTSQTGLTTLAEITDPAEIELLEEVCESSARAALSESFGELMRHFRTKPGIGSTADREADPTILQWIKSGRRKAERGTGEEDDDPSVLRLRERLAAAQRGNDDDSSDGSSMREVTA